MCATELKKPYIKSTWLPNSTFSMSLYLLYIPQSLSHTSSGSTSFSLYYLLLHTHTQPPTHICICTRELVRSISLSMNLPPGFRFFPTDEELVVHFLHRKSSLLPCHPDVIPDLDLYPYDPWDLPGIYIHTHISDLSIHIYIHIMRHVHNDPIVH